MNKMANFKRSNFASKSGVTKIFCQRTTFVITQQFEGSFGRSYILPNHQFFVIYCFFIADKWIHGPDLAQKP